MKGDFTRRTFDRKKHYNSVQDQQGRVKTDADNNEQIAIQNYIDGITRRDVIGHCGVPKNGGGFEIELTSDRDFQISAGRIYVDGFLCENEEAVNYLKQPDYPGQTLPPAGGDGVYLAYLDVWERHITALEDPAIREVALGGPDTATRIKTLWQVKLHKMGEPGEKIECPNSGPGWRPRDVAYGELRARAVPAPASDDPCIIPPGAGYRRLENQFYRVEVHQSGPHGEATFKWSRNNACFATRLEAIDGDTITVANSGKDTVLGFAPGQWVEISDEYLILNGLPGILVELARVENNKLTVAAWPGGTPPTPGEKPTVRPWDSPGEIPITTGSYISLEDGIEVEFGTGWYQTGNYWWFPARTNTGNIEWPLDTAGDESLFQQPYGIEHHYCALALVEFIGEFIRFHGTGDCRPHFPPLTDICTGGGNCFEFLDELRSNGIVKSAKGELGLAVSRLEKPEQPLLIGYSAGVAFVGGCRYEVPGGELTIEPGNTQQILLVNNDGKVQLITKGELPAQYAEIALISTYKDEIICIKDIRFDLTHLDEKVQQNYHRTTEARIDRRQFVPLLANSIKGLRYKDGRNRIFPLSKIISEPFMPNRMAFDGNEIWLTNTAGPVVAKILQGAADAQEATFFTLPNPRAASWAVASDGCHMWYTLPELNQIALVDRNNLQGKIRFIELGHKYMISQGTLEALRNAGVPNSVIDKLATLIDRIYTGREVFLEVLLSRIGQVQLTKYQSLILQHSELGSPRDIAFDGERMWVCNYGSNSDAGSVIVIDARTHQIIHRIELPPDGDVVYPRPLRAAFDGEYMYIATTGKARVFKIATPVGEPELVLTIPLTTPDVPEELSLAFDGTHMWTSAPNSPLIKFDVMDKVGEYTALEHILGINDTAFDGMYLWALRTTTHPQDSYLTKIDPYSEKIVGEHLIGRRGKAILFDGTHIWASWSEGLSYLLSGVLKKLV